jgi:hypothetical protein
VSPKSQKITEEWNESSLIYFYFGLTGRIYTRNFGNWAEGSSILNETTLSNWWYSRSSVSNVGENLTVSGEIYISHGSIFQEITEEWNESSLISWKMEPCAWITQRKARIRSRTYKENYKATGEFSSTKYKTVDENENPCGMAVFSQPGPTILGNYRGVKCIFLNILKGSV